MELISEINKFSLCEKLEYCQYTIKNLIIPDLKIYLPELKNYFCILSDIKNIRVDQRLSYDEIIIDLRENTYIQNHLILKAILAILGSINSKNDFTKFTSDVNSDLSEKLYIDNMSGIFEHLHQNIFTVFSEFKVSDFKLYLQALDYIGINISNTALFNEIKIFIFKNNKIFIVITPNENFWIKSDKETINGSIFDKRLNNYYNIFYNWNFIKDFYDRIANHPRCLLGIMNSMNSKNLKPCIEFINLQVNNFTKFIMLDQNSHTNKENDYKKKPIFVRDFKKIKQIGQISTDINETNTLIVESEKDKCEDSIINNTVFFSCFKEKENLPFNTLIDYLADMLENCDGYLREYISLNKLK